MGLGVLVHLFVTTAAAALLALDVEDTLIEAKVTILANSNTDGISGEINFRQADVNSPLRIFGTVRDLPAGLHGFHVHERGQTGNDCSTAGGHFNPGNTQHGSRTSTVRH